MLMMLKALIMLRCVVLFSIFGGSLAALSNRILLKRSVDENAALKLAQPNGNDNGGRNLDEIPLVGAPYLFSAQVCFTASETSCVPLQLDTGSADIWAGGSKCSYVGPETSCCNVPDRCKTVTASSYTSTAKTFKDNYDGGSSSGVEANTVISFLGDSTSAVSMTAGIVNEMSSMHLTDKMSGIFGLGFSDLAKVTSPAFAEQDTVHFFTMHLNLEPQSNDSWLEINGGDDDATLHKYAGANASFHYAYILNTPIGSTKYGYWYMCMTSFGVVGSRELICNASSGCAGVVDSGTSLMIVPHDSWDAFLQVLGCADSPFGFPRCKASSYEDLPHLQMSLGGVFFDVHPQDYAACSDDNECFLLASRGVSWERFWVWGDRFISRYLLKFDVDNKRVGFACSGSSSDTSYCEGYPQSIVPAQSCGIYPDVAPRPKWTYYMEGIAFGAAVVLVVLLARRWYARRRFASRTLREPMLVVTTDV